jgi:ribokinase
MGKTALFVGDVTLDLTMVASHIPNPDEKVHVSHSVEAVGGVIANAAVACARTGTSAKALFQLGSDNASTVVEMALVNRGIDIAIDKVEGRTSRVVVIIEPHGEKRLLLDPGVSLYPSEQAVRLIDLRNVNWVHTAVYGEAAELLVSRCRQSKLAWSLDLEPASFPEGIHSLASVIDGAAVVFCNDRAAAAIGDQATETLLSMGAKAVIRTLGSGGARYLSADAAVRAFAPEIAIADTTGAGDCLAGWFVGEVVAGTPVNAALQAAVVAATLSCRFFGAQNSYPDRFEVSQALKAMPNHNQIKCEET